MFLDFFFLLGAALASFLRGCQLLWGWHSSTHTLHVLSVALARLVCGMVAWSFPLPLLLFPNSSSGLQPLSASLLFPNTPELLIGFVLMYTVQNHPSPGMDKGVVHIYNRMLLSH